MAGPFWTARDGTRATSLGKIRSIDSADWAIPLITSSISASVST